MDSGSFYTDRKLTKNTFSDLKIQLFYTGPAAVRLMFISLPGLAVWVNRLMVLYFAPVGTECFLAQMRAQKGELLERLSSARSFSNMDDEENYSAASRAVRQVGGCCRH